MKNNGPLIDYRCSNYNYGPGDHTRLRMPEFAADDCITALVLKKPIILQFIINNVI